jgi:farnesyl diphosphate synthase
VAILTLQEMKTGALLRFACMAGALLGQASEADLATLSRFGELVGQAFQIADDLLDVESDSATLGKAAGKDAEAGKATLVGILGLDAAKARLERLIAEAEATLAPFGARASLLVEAAKFIANRQN